MRCCFLCWLLGLVALTLLGWLAHHFQTNDLTDRLAAAGSAATELAGVPGITVTMDGRDAVLAGTAESADAKAKVRDAVLGVYGIRRVDASGVNVKPPKPPKPSITPLETKDPKAPIAGTWTPQPETVLAVTYGGVTYSGANDTGLKLMDGGSWELRPRGGLKLGTHGVRAIVTGAADNRSDEATAQITLIPLTPPDAPNILKIENTERGQLPVIGGTWPEKGGNTLSVMVGGRTYHLGKDPQLTSDGNGNWVLRLSEPLEQDETPVQAKVTNPDRLSALSGEKIVALTDTTPPGIPTVNALQAKEDAPVEISGTWDQAEAVSLRVAVAGQTYERGKSSELTSDANGNWKLALGLLSPGTYDVSVETADAKGNASRDATRDEISISAVDRTPPGIPTVESYAGESQSPELRGTFDQNETDRLRVGIDGKTYLLGQDAGLSAPGNGVWVLRDVTLAPGTYDVTVETADANGNVSRDTTRNEVTVSEPPPPPPPPPPAPMPEPPKPAPAPEPPKPAACLSEFDGVMDGRPLYFRINSSDIRREIMPLLDDIAGYAKRCPQALFGVAGHTDSSGTRRHNEGLSERRTRSIIRALEERGVEAGRVKPVEWFGETQPIDTNGSREGRQNNRRVEIRLIR